ncbi:MAG: hypothetical protein IJ677_03520 [Alphaproteobacteria bacterium]|nr:hypothetical protein [Alphaproteobacteria bacterium]
MIRIFYRILFFCGLIFSANAQEIKIPEENPVAEVSEISEQSSTETASARPASEFQNNIESENQKDLDEQVVYVDAEVFSPTFMKNLIACTPDTENNQENTVEIIGIKNNKCQIKYANFDLNVPTTLLGNIHSFEDIETLLKNKDISHYNYRVDYIYEGLVYALDACSKQKDYFGKQEELSDEYVIINRSLSAEFVNGICVINLQNTQNIDGVESDYGVTCSLSFKEVKKLEPYFKDIIEKYGERRGFGTDGHIMVKPAEQNKKTHESDVALMYYMQKNGFCKKNSD